MDNAGMIAGTDGKQATDTSDTEHAFRRGPI